MENLSDVEKSGKKAWLEAFTCTHSATSPRWMWIVQHSTRANAENKLSYRIPSPRRQTCFPLIARSTFDCWKFPPNFDSLTSVYGFSRCYGTFRWKCENETHASSSGYGNTFFMSSINDIGTASETRRAWMNMRKKYERKKTTLTYVSNLLHRKCVLCEHCRHVRNSRTVSCFFSARPA